jgi:hypothetical protein
MKKINFYRGLFLSLLLVSFTSYVKSQNCNMYYALVNGSAYEMTNFDDKGKEDGKTINKISNVVSSSEAIMAKVETTNKDKNDVITSTNNSSVKCTGNKILIEIKRFIPSQYMEQWKDMDIKSDATWLEIPQIIGIGQTLKNGSGTISVYNNSTLFTTMKISIVNRKVVGKESIVTSAGTFDCFKITYDIKLENTTMGVTTPVNMKSSEYYAAGTGSVKTESYDKNNKLMGYSLLTKITKP